MISWSYLQHERRPHLQTGGCWARSFPAANQSKDRRLPALEAAQGCESLFNVLLLLTGGHEAVLSSRFKKVAVVTASSLLLDRRSHRYVRSSADAF